MLAPYVDNANAVVWDEADAEQYSEALQDVLAAWGLAYRVECPCSAGWDTIGVTLLATSRLLLNKPLRAWRLRGAILTLLRQGSCTGRTMGVLAGHLVYIFQVQRVLLSAMWAIYQVIYHSPELVRPFDAF